MDSFDRPYADLSGAAVVRQPEKPSSDSQPRADRVAELRDQYQRGIYHIDAAALSTTIVEKHLKK